MQHLTYGGSTAKRSLACPGWVKTSEGIPSSGSTEAARQGSLHHEVQELCRKTDTLPADHIGFTYTEDDYTLTFDEDCLPLSEIAYHAVESLLDTYAIEEYIIEPFVQLVKGKVGGSIDLLGVNRETDTVVINDYKFGSFKVVAEENEQMFLYAAAAMADPITAGFFTENTKIVFAITQPRARIETYTWETNVAAVLDFQKRFLTAIDTDVVRSGTHCKFCPAAAYCKVRKQTLFSTNILSADLRERLQEAADLADEAASWAKAVHQEVYLQMSRGVPIAGWKLVERDKHRRWIDEGHTAALLAEHLPEEETHKKALRTPAQITKLVKEANLDMDLSDHIEKPKGTLTIAIHSDPRTEVVLGDNPEALTTLVKSSS